MVRKTGVRNHFEAFLARRRMVWRSLARLGALATFALVAPIGCTIGLRSAVTMTMSRAKVTPRDASVYIDEEFIGPFYYVAAHGVRLPTGKHRVSVTREGYFPWDQVVEADRQPIALNVELVAVPD
jgi:hypothetical protein